ncbi:UNVERIFIED_CONTAM: ywzG [Trichonephila clavipes]|uniref:PadR family transcriptional regulator n=1 Tax=Sphingobacterium tenebrionis TaxID=3111775 RepID=A0ABU8I346_9SPHI|nr:MULTISPECIES: PadR family transcriptional regulator [unclassified Sphingobacterium]QBR11728.1 PadR family transcriptional regulator [Sphingobacterium sp. CZ-2]
MKDSKLLKGTLQTIILKLLSGTDRMYGYEITQQVKQLTEGEFVLTEGALYPALHKLEAEGLLATESEIVDGRARKYYSLTAKGKEEQVAKVQDALTFVEKLQLILNAKPSIS